MPSTVALRARTLALASAVALATSVVACSGGEPDPTGEPDPAGEPAAESAGSGDAEAAASRARRYEVRGQIVRVPDPTDRLSDLVIRHEPIADFEGIDGAKVGMSSMAMPFPVAPGVTLADIAPGDKVAFTLEVDWQADPAYRITRLEKLAAETELEFADKQSREPTEPAAGGMIPPPEEYPVEEPPVV